IALLITSRLYLMEGKEKANGYPRTALGASAQGRPHRPQVCESGAGSGEAVTQAPSLFRGRADQWAGRLNSRRRALRNREALRAASPPRQHGYLEPDRAA